MRIILLSFIILISCKNENNDMRISSKENVVVNEHIKEDSKSLGCIDNLINAIVYNDTIKLIQLIDSGCDVNEMRKNGINSYSSALGVASGMNNLNAIQILLDAGAEPNLDHGKNVSPLVSASRFNDGALEIMIKKGADVNYFNPQSNYCQSPVICAIKSGNITGLKFLVQNGAKINCDPKKLINKDSTKYLPRLQYPLHVAVANKQLEIVKYLIELGCDPSQKVTDDYADCILCPQDIPPIHYIGYYDNDSLAIELIDLLLDSGTDINIKAGGYMNALAFIAPRKSKHLAKYLISKGIEIQSEAIIRAASFQNNEFLEVLLKNGGDPNARNNETSALLSAIQCCGDGFNDTTMSQRIPTIETLMSFGCKPDKKALEILDEQLILTLKKYGYHKNYYKIADL